MKRILLTAMLACFMGGQVCAQQAQQPFKTTAAKKAGHRKGLSLRRTAGVLPMQKSSSAPSSLIQSKSVSAQSVTKDIRRATVAPKDLRKHDFLPYDTLLVTAHTRQLNGQTLLNQQVEYDEYGLYRMFTSVDEKGKTETRYTYSIGIANYWTSRFIEQRQNGGSWKPMDKEERTFNDEEQLISVKQYRRTDRGELYLYMWTEYDYSHEFVRDGEVISPGAMTRCVKYDTEGKVTSEENYAWFAPAKDYICTLLVDPASSMTKEITKFEGNTTVTELYQTNMDGVEYVKEKVTRYYGLTEEGRQVEGELRVSYNDRYGDGEYYTEGKKTESKGFDENGQLIPGQDAEFWEYDYDRYDKTWDLRDHKKYHWLNNNLLETQDVRYGYSDYELFNDEGMPINPEGDGKYDVEYDPKLQQFTVYYGPRYGGHEYMDVYDLQNNLVARYRLQLLDFGLCEKGFSEVFANDIEFIGFKISVWKDGQWQPRTEPMQFDEYDEGKLDERGFYYFNDKGEIIKEEWYEFTSEDSAGTLEERLIYTYLENEININTFSNFDQPSPDRGNVWLKRLSNGMYEYANLEYKGRHIGDQVDWGTYGLIDTNQGYVKMYSTSGQEQEWSNPYYRYLDQVSVDPETGVETRISREYNSETDQVVYTRKTERLDNPETGYHLHAEYSWDADHNAWRGEHKIITEPRQKNLPILPVRYPKGNDDYSNYPAEPEYEEVIEAQWPGLDMNGAMYSWQWYMNEAGQVEGVWQTDVVNFVKVYPMENGGYYVDIIKGDRYHESSNKYWLELNGQQQIVKLKTVKSNSLFNGIKWENENYEADIEFTYNEKGFVTERKEMPYKVVDNKWVKTDDVLTDHYVYTVAKVTPTGIDEVETHETFTLKGREITTTEQALITVYDLSGRKVTEAFGQLSLPAVGLYLVHCNGQTVKVYCR